MWKNQTYFFFRNQLENIDERIYHVIQFNASAHKL